MEGPQIDPGLSLDWPRNWPVDGPWIGPGLTQDWACGRNPDWHWTYQGLVLWTDPGFSLDLPRTMSVDWTWTLDRPRTDRSGTAQGLVSLVRPGPAAEPFNVPQRNWMSAYTVNRDCHMQRHISDFWAEYNSLEESRTYTFTSTPSLTGSNFYAEIQIVLGQCTVRGQGLTIWQSVGVSRPCSL